MSHAPILAKTVVTKNYIYGSTMIGVPTTIIGISIERIVSN